MKYAAGKDYGPGKGGKLFPDSPGKKIFPTEIKHQSQPKAAFNQNGLNNPEIKW